MKISDILNTSTDELRTMDVKRLQSIVQQAQNASIRRLNAIETKGLTFVSPAYQTWNDRLRNNSLNTTKKNRLRLISELRQNQRFLNDKTSLVKGARGYRKKMHKIIPNVPEQDYNRFWGAVDAIRELNYTRFTQLPSDTVVETLQAAWNGSLTKEETHEKFTKLFDEAYKRSNERLKGQRPDPHKYRA